MLFKSIVLALGALATVASAQPARHSDINSASKHQFAARRAIETIVTRSPDERALSVVADLEIKADVFVDAFLEFAVEVDLNLDPLQRYVAGDDVQLSVQLEAVVALFVDLEIDLSVLFEAHVDLSHTCKGNVIVLALVKFGLALDIDLGALLHLEVNAEVVLTAFAKLIVTIGLKVDVFLSFATAQGLAKRAVELALAQRDLTIAAGVNVDVAIDVEIEVAVFVQAILELYASLDIDLSIIATLIKEPSRCGCQPKQIQVLLALFLALDLDLSLLLDVSQAEGVLQGEAVAVALVDFAVGLGIDVQGLAGANLDVTAEAFVSLLVTIGIKVQLFVQVAIKVGIELAKRGLQI